MAEILTFKTIAEEDKLVVGDKAAKLGLLSQRFSVPNGFVITKELFEKFMKATQLDVTIMSALRMMDTRNKDRLQSLANKIQKEIVYATIPEEIAEVIREHYYSLNIAQGASLGEVLNNQEGPFVAVRSSTVGYVDPAKLHMSFFNIQGEERLFKAILTCWASFFTARAIEYRHFRNITSPSLAIVIQLMLNPAQAGVAYSTHPNNHEEMLVLGCLGLGSGMISGDVIPDRYRIRKSDVTVLDLDIRKQTVVFQRDLKTHKTAKVELRGDLGMRQKLTEGQVRDVGLLARRIERYFKLPQQIEFAIEKGEIYVVQSQDLPGFEGSTISEDEEPEEHLEEPTLKKEEEPLRSLPQTTDAPEEAVVAKEGFSMIVSPSSTQQDEINRVLSGMNLAIRAAASENEVSKEEAVTKNEHETDSVGESAPQETYSNGYFIPDVPFESLQSLDDGLLTDDDVSAAIATLQAEEQTELREPDNEALQSQEEPSTVDPSQQEDNASTVIQCHDTIHSALKKKYEELKGASHEGTFGELVEELSGEINIPYVEELVKINNVRQTYEQEQLCPQSEDAKLAVDVCNAFLQEFS